MHVFTYASKLSRRHDRVEIILISIDVEAVEASQLKECIHVVRVSETAREIKRERE